MSPFLIVNQHIFSNGFHRDEEFMEGEPIALGETTGTEQRLFIIRLMPLCSSEIAYDKIYFQKFNIWW